ncbi:MAG: hypothetical protein K0S21_3296 [Rhizobiaceae bacterium]|nr:hypothetical protein [Rhizobiaceae bacterium]
MHTKQHATIEPTVSLHTVLEALVVALRATAKRVRMGHEAARRQRCVAELAPHLRYDVGEMDLIPPLPRTLREIQHSDRQSLEAMWLRHF